MKLEERIQKLKEAYANGKVSKEIYEANVAKIQAEIAAEKKAKAPAPAPKKEIKDEDAILADLLKREPPAAKDVDLDLGLGLSDKKEPEDEELDDFLDSISKQKMDEPSEKDDDLLLDDLFDSLVLREEEFNCPLCGTGLPKSTLVCTNCNAHLTEEGELKKEVAIDSLAESIEEGLAELEDLAEEIISDEPAVEEVQPEPVPVLKPEAKPAVEEPIDEDIDIPDKLEITEESLPKMHLLGFRLIDLVVFGTVIALVVIFFLFGLHDTGNFNTFTGGMFFGIAIAGILVSFLLFRISTSAIAEGDRQFKAENYQQAMENYERAIRFSNKPASAWTSKGVAQKRLGDYGAALRSHNAALKLNPKNEIAWCNKGDLLFRLGRMELALECYDNAIDINPRYAIAWNNKGTTLAKLERFEKAKKCQDIATRLKPRYAAAWVNKGEIYARLGNRDEAIICYQKARKLVGA